MMLDYVTPSLDTTILGITAMIALFAAHPDQWDLVRADRSLVPHAINIDRLADHVERFEVPASRLLLGNGLRGRAHLDVKSLSRM